MAKGNIRLYDTEVEYLAEKDSFELPNVSFVEDIKTVFYSGKLTKSWDTMANGVYAVGADGSPVMVEDADESCIGVALIANDAPTPQRLMIEKNETNNTTSIKAAYDADGATDTGYTYFFWGMRGQDVSDITNYTQTGGGGTKSYGNLPKPDGTYNGTPNLSADYTTWTSGCLSDFSGKANTAALMEVEDADSYTTYANMATWCSKFNETPSENQGFNDWYIPSMGQLALIYLNKTAINEALTKIGGMTFASNYYWSSSEYSSTIGFYVSFSSGSVNYNLKSYGCRVRVVRDLI